MCQPSNSMLTYCYYCFVIIINENEPPTITKDDEMCNNIIYVSKHRRDMHFYIFNIRVMDAKREHVEMPAKQYSYIISAANLHQQFYLSACTYNNRVADRENPINNYDPIMLRYKSTIVSPTSMRYAQRSNADIKQAVSTICQFQLAMGAATVRSKKKCGFVPQLSTIFSIVLSKGEQNEEVF